VKRLNALDRPAPADIDLWVSMFYRSCATYRPAYRAACHYGAAALRAAAALTLPAVFTATVEDMLFPHLDRLPPLRPGQRIERLPSEPAARIAAIAGFLAEFESGGEAPAATLPSPMARHLFIRGPHGEIFLRRYGDPAQPALLLLHDAPGTGRGLAETARRLAADHHVLVPDQPGCGLTAAPPAGDILEAAADNALALLDALGLERVTVAATGCGAAVAARLADRADPRIARLYAAGAPPPDAARIAPDLPLSATGAHWVQAWLMLRDAEIYAPWYEGTVAAQRRTQGNFDALERHEQTAALMEGRTTYHLYPRAAAAAPSTHPAITALPAGALRDFTPGTAPC
jgi:pimeloyl-ACP methyl ester carboxylesterase